MDVFVFLTFVKEICSFAGYSLGEFRVRWSRFDAITDRKCQVITTCEFTKTDSNMIVFHLFKTRQEYGMISTS